MSDESAVQFPVTWTKRKLQIEYIITEGWFKPGPSQDQPSVRDRGWFVYPDKGEGMVKVMIVRVEE